MGLTLDNFYQSKEWVNLMKIIRQERVNENGEIICAYCGKPIVKAYDCIGHHKVYLTEQNVNDAMISLNPENVELVHHVCHNRIHDKFGYKHKEIYLNKIQVLFQITINLLLHLNIQMVIKMLHHIGF